jgi:hypothetical protein
MTTITAEPASHRPVGRLTRRTLTSFLAGAIVAGGLAVGITVATGDATPTAHATSHAHAAAVVATEPGCLVRQGQC